MNSISKTTQIYLVLSGIGLIACMFIPIWWIGLEAPQYPEGMEIVLWANNITGDIDIINDLNHYVGMKEIHTADFWEFGVMRYILGIYALLFFVSGFAKRRALLYITTILFIIFGVAFITDFYIWEYKYGHNLDPKAAIKIPGESYQPPLIGPKQVLNFFAQSYPYYGASIMFLIGLVCMWLSIKEFKASKKS